MSVLIFYIYVHALICTRVNFCILIAKTIVFFSHFFRLSLKFVLKRWFFVLKLLSD
jgi:hypothetical protein